MHVDGFRFDLASTLARQFHEVDRLSAFFDLIQQDPVVSRVKLIAEPWDVGEAATRSATSRRCGRSGTASTATRSATTGAARARRSASSPPASPDRATFYENDGRRPSASINFVTAHDGFTLNDLVSYNESTTRPTARAEPTGRPQPLRGTTAPRTHRRRADHELRSRQRRTS
jgi:glycogen operon protein